MQNKQKKQAKQVIFDRSSIEKKQSIIKVLQQRNNKLHEQIKLIEKTIAQKLQNKQQKIPKKRQSIVKIEQNVQLLSKQLSNCYKKVKLYEYEVNKYQKLQNEIGPGQRIIQVQLEIKQKKQISQKMKHQMLTLQKQISDNSKKLGGNHQMHQNEKHSKQLNDQINFLKEMVKQYQQKQSNKQNLLKKQYAHLKKLQNEFVQNGGSISEIDQLKQKAIANLSLSSKGNKINLQSISNKKMNSIQTNNNEQEQISERSSVNIQTMINQKNVLQKLNKKFQKQINQAQKSQNQTIQRNNISKQKLLDLDEKITQLQIKISQQKGNILPSNMKPQKALKSISTHQSAKIKYQIRNNSSYNSKSMKSRNLNHILKYETVGFITNQGISFTDRNILGQAKLETKIIGLNVFVDKQKQLINGIQAIYNKKKYGGQHLKKDRTSKNIHYKQQHFMCQEEDFIKTIGGTFNLQDKLQSISVVTNLKQKYSFGLMKNTKKAFLFEIGQNEFPVCIFGSMLLCKDAYKQYSTIQYLGVQIFSNVNSQIQQKKQDTSNYDFPSQ